VSVFQEISSLSKDLSTPELLRVLIKEKFPGKVVVTASLRARSIVVLKMVADIDPATPVVFCHPGNLFPESRDYRKRIVERLALADVRDTRGGEATVRPGDDDHYENMWAEYLSGHGRVHEIVHLNDTLAPFDCWISAVYHFSRPPQVHHRVDVEGRLIRIDPLIRWSQDDVRRFMRENGLPFHPRAAGRKPTPPPQEAPCAPTYHF
jgi:phosphoadenosine phosphosulfate reductase